MKKLCVLIVFASLLSACGGKSGSSSEANFKITPNNIEKFESPLYLGQTITTNTGAHTINYAIIYSGTINNTNYVGIACSDNPKNETYNFKIYFIADSIPTGSNNITGATVIQNGSRTTNESINLNISGPTTVTGGDNSYDTYNITISSSTSTIITSSSTITTVQVGPNS